MPIEKSPRQTSIVAFGLLVLPLLLSMLSPVIASTVNVQQDATENTPENTWSEDYINDIFPWASADDRILQFKEYHSYETMKLRMQQLTEQNPDIFEFHEGMNGGVNARGETVTVETTMKVAPGEERSAEAISLDAMRMVW